MDTIQVIFLLLMGFSLAATCGLRAFLPLFIIALAGKAGYISIAPSFEWMVSWPALICFGTATVLEILADKIPAVDHVLDAAGIYIRPVAGALAASSMIQGMDPLLGLVIGIIMGASIAGIVQTIKGMLRLFSSSVTGGLANPAISFVEDGTAAVTSILSLVTPVLTALLIVIGLVLVWRFASGSFRRLRRPTGHANT